MAEEAPREPVFPEDAGGPGKKAAKKKTASAGTAASPATGAPSDEEIRQRAYEICRERGGEHGADESDWHRAERELRERDRRKDPEES